MEAARTLPIRDLQRAIEHWRQLTDAAGADDTARRRFERRGLFVSVTMGGMVRLDGCLDPETGQTVVTAVSGVVDADARGADEDARRPRSDGRMPWARSAGATSTARRIACDATLSRVITVGRSVPLDGSGGDTSLANLVLLCRRHHRLVHERFAVRTVDGRSIFTREDGTILPDRAPP